MYDVLKLVIDVDLYYNKDFINLFLSRLLQIVNMSARLSALSNQINREQNRLYKWRQQFPLCRKAFRNTLYSEKYAKIIDQTFDVMISNPQIFKHSNMEDFNRAQQRLNAAQMVLTMHQLRPVRPEQYKTDIHALSIVAHAIYHFDPGLSVKCDITFFLYAKTVYFFAGPNPIQQKMAEDAMTYKHIGCFGLTQLGHGSNVKGILTQAIYDHDKKQFVIHSPRKEAMKFWIGAAAELATMAVIWAQLIIDGVEYGPHPFVVPLRDPKNHQVFEGVTIGDCGSKNGLNGIDNGYILFNNYRIPKDNGLNRISGVDQNGKFFFKTKSMDRLFGLYMGPLSVGRAFVACNSVSVANSSLAIAIRYTCNRRQFGADDKEQLLIDYPLMRFRIMPYLAQSLVYLFGGINLLQLYDKNLKQLLNPHNKILNQLHAITGPCKAKSSWFTSKVITECREICGGHGYSSYSGLSRIYHGQDINTSWQGDNNMLLQQTTKYILKILNKLNKGKTFQNNTLGFLTQNLEVEQNPNKQLLYNLDYLEKVIKLRIRELSQECISEMIEQRAEGKKPMQIWNQAQPYFGNSMSLAYGDLYYLQLMKKIIPKFEPNWKQVIQNCTRLWVLSLLDDWRWGNFQTRKIIKLSIVELIQWLAPRSVSIIDSMAAPSQIIGSVFADQSGEGMKHYITKLFTGKKVFQKVKWSDNIIKARNQI